MEDHIAITRSLKEDKLKKIKGEFSRVSIVFVLVCVLPILLYLFYDFGLFTITKKGEFQSLEEATSLLFNETEGTTGTAFLVSETKALTARHVVEQLNVGEKVVLNFDQASPPFQINATLEYKGETSETQSSLKYFLTDFALLRVDDPEVISNNGIQPIPIGNSDGLGNLTEVIAIGYPSGDYSIKRGDINSDSFNDLDLFKVDPAANPGDSGGPLVQKETKSVIGILVGGSPGSQGENIAIKINNIREILSNEGFSMQ